MIRRRARCQSGTILAGKQALAEAPQQEARKIHAFHEK